MALASILRIIAREQAWYNRNMAINTISLKKNSSVYYYSFT